MGRLINAEAMSIHYEAYGKQFPVAEATGGDTIEQLKAKFEAEYGVKAEDQELIANGHTFLDEEQVRGSKFHLRLLNKPSEYWWLSTPGKYRPTWEQGLGPAPDISHKADKDYQSPYHVVGGGHKVKLDDGTIITQEEYHRRNPM